MGSHHTQSMKRIGVIVGFALSLSVIGANKQPAWGGQEEQFTPEFKEVRRSFEPKHTPKIVAPDSVKRGQWFDVIVNIGAGSEHPSLSEHFVRYIALYINTAEIARVYLHPVYSFPKVTFTIALDEGGSLRAIAEPTHSAGWEASKKIVVR
jgi:superoxide reductase